MGCASLASCVAVSLAHNWLLWCMLAGGQRGASVRIGAEVLSVRKQHPKSAALKLKQSRLLCLGVDGCWQCEGI
jgi:hypothetical protein